MSLSSLIERALIRWGILADDEQSAYYAAVDARLDEMAQRSRERGVMPMHEVEARWSRVTGEEVQQQP